MLDVDIRWKPSAKTPIDGIWDLGRYVTDFALRRWFTGVFRRHAHSFILAIMVISTYKTWSTRLPTRLRCTFPAHLIALPPHPLYQRYTSQ
jgi:hypothetical protein